MKRLAKTLLVAASLLIWGCSQKPATMYYGSDECSHCKMIISDERFASQVVTKTGKAIRFDSIECMGQYAGDHKTELKGAKFWISDFSRPGSWMEAGKAKIIRSEVIHSPMGASLLAVSDRKAAESHLAAYPGKTISWQQIVK